jgi:hypothetical protein
MRTSQNGYSAPIGPVSRKLPGGTVPLRAGVTGDLLAWVGAQFHSRVEALEWPGCWGYAFREVVGGQDLSNHASGTAIDLNAPRHPLGTAPSANYSAAQIAEIHALLAEVAGCVRWGGDYAGRKDGMHFEIVATEARCAAALGGLGARFTPPEQEDDMPGPQDHEYPPSGDRQFHHRTIETRKTSQIVGDVWFALSSGYQDLADLHLYFNHEQAPIVLASVPKDTRKWWPVPDGCESISWDYVCAGPSSSSLVYGPR